MITVFPDLTDRSQDDDNVAMYEAEKSVTLGSPVYKGQSRLGQSSSEGKDTNGVTPREGKFQTYELYLLRIETTLYVFLS